MLSVEQLPGRHRGSDRCGFLARDRPQLGNPHDIVRLAPLILSLVGLRLTHLHTTKAMPIPSRRCDGRAHSKATGDCMKCLDITHYLCNI